MASRRAGAIQVPARARRRSACDRYGRAGGYGSKLVCRPVSVPSCPPWKLDLQRLATNQPFPGCDTGFAFGYQFRFDSAFAAFAAPAFLEPGPERAAAIVMTLAQGVERFAFPASSKRIP